MKKISLPNIGTIIGFDPGIKRTGIACADLSLKISHGLTTICAGSLEEQWPLILKLLEEWNPCAFVIGQPETKNGTPHELSKLYIHLESLLKTLNKPIFFVNENYTSVEANDQLKTMKRRFKKKSIDQLASKIILDTFLESINEITVHS